MRKITYLFSNIFVLEVEFSEPTMLKSSIDTAKNST